MQSSFARCLAWLAGISACSLLALVVSETFISGVLADERVLARVDTLESYVRFWPESARIQARLAEARITDPDRDLNATQAGARLACSLSPFDYRYRLLLATVEEAAGDQQAAESALEAARNLAPNNTEVAWRQANLLLREGKLDEAAARFQAACQSDLQLVPLSVDLLWRASSESATAIESVTPPDARSRLNLASFLALHSRHADAARVFSSIPRSALLNLPGTSAFIAAMIQDGEWELARNLWADTIGIDSNRLPLVWNGGFETAPQKSLNHFDWQFEHSDYADVKIDSSTAHSGSRSLKIAFRGRDTTKLDREITQQVVLRSGSRYRLECFVKTDQLDTPEGPSIVVANQTTGESIAASAPIGSGTNDWRRLTLDFAAPAANTGYVLLTVSIKRKPRFSYDEPTRGVMWLDDFGIEELGIKN